MRDLLLNWLFLYLQFMSVRVNPRSYLFLCLLSPRFLLGFSVRAIAIARVESSFPSININVFITKSFPKCLAWYVYQYYINIDVLKNFHRQNLVMPISVNICARIPWTSSELTKGSFSDFASIDISCEIFWKTSSFRFQ